MKLINQELIGKSGQSAVMNIADNGVDFTHRN